MAGQHEQGERVSGHVLRMAIGVVVSHLSNNAVAPAELPKLISDVYHALAAPAYPRKPAVAVLESVTPDYIVCLEDGRKFKKLKHHIRSAHGLTLEQYRARWNLPIHHSMTAPNFSKLLSQLGKQIRPALRRG